MGDLDPQVEQQLADMSDQDWRALQARVRPPTSTDQLKSVASQVLSGDQLDAFMAVANPKAFANETGDVDEERVMGHLTAIFGTGQRVQQAPPQFGQHSGQPPGAARVGDSARAELARRFGGKTDTTAPSAASVARPGERGRAEAARRYGNRKGQR